MNKAANNTNSWEPISKNLKKIWMLNSSSDSSDKGYFNKYLQKVIKKQGLYLESARRFGTPQYILDEGELKERAVLFMAAFKKEIKNTEFFYPFKCNDLPYLINILKNMGFHADVSGLFELELALKLGFDKIIFSSPGKEKEELILALKNRERVIISIDNLDELELLLELSDDINGKNIRGKDSKGKTNRKINISFRVNLSDSISQSWSKFGLSPNELKKGLSRIRGSGLKWTGIHFHSSWNDTPEYYIKNIELVGRFLRENVKAEAIAALEFLDIGGGFYPEGEGTLFMALPKGKLLNLLELEKIPHKTDFDDTNHSITDPQDIFVFAKEISKAIKKHILKLNSNIAVYCEPGRFITKHSTRIITKVLAIKEKGCIVDAGTSTLIGENSLAEYEYAPILNLSSPSLDLNKFRVYGALCDPYDIWGFSYYGSRIQNGDLLSILNQGAYTFSFAQRFIKPIAPYIVIKENNSLICAKKKESFKERYSKCRMFL